MMEEARMAIAETLKVTNRVDDKVTVLVDANKRSANADLRETLQKWLAPSDPSINHNIARKAHHNGTASWFFQGNFLSCGSMANRAQAAESGKSILWHFLLLLRAFTQIIAKLWYN
ncbi:hypothetical protein BJV77DRAFT_562014 [Russula vinacea]|nr:hypothetical protein BJV77DRAFT_562014 [Russula vinacea]